MKLSSFKLYETLYRNVLLTTRIGRYNVILVGNVNEEHLAEGEDETPPEEPETRAPEPEPTTPSKSKKYQQV